MLNVKLMQKRVKRVLIDIEDIDRRPITMDFQGRSELKLPSKEDNTFLLVSQISGKENTSKKTCMELVVDYFFEYESDATLTKEEYDDLISEQCISTIKDDMEKMIMETLKSLDLGQSTDL